MQPDIANNESAVPFWNFDYQPRTRIIYGENTIDRVGDLARELGLRKVMLVTDAGIIKAGHVERAQRSLQAAGIQVTVFADAKENPTGSSVEVCRQVASAAAIDGIIGLGGGSAMDTAKGCNFVLTNGGTMRDYWGVGKATRPMLPLIAIPTTAGTGSECQSAALIVDDETHQKMACLDRKAAAKIAILDPTLTVSQPQRVTAYTGIDAIAHSLETAVSTKRNALSSALSREAFRLCINAFPEVLQDPANIDARGRMLLGASMAGLAIENSMLGAAHAAANPLTAMHGLVHGLAVGMMLPTVVRFNAAEESSRAAYSDLAESVPPALFQNSHPDLSCSLQKVLELANFPGSLKDCGVTADSVPSLAADAAKQWTATFNPRRASARDFEQIYHAALAS
jgi:alcohol dehydrogenase